jgi:ABC-type transport system involved in multi-copper enzyme maturation permease subunit
MTAATAVKPAAGGVAESLVKTPSKLTFGEFCRGTRLVAARELGAYFDSSIAYVYIIAFAVLSSSIFMNEFFLAGRVEMKGFFERMPLLLGVFLPAVTMRLWAEERKQRTLELLLTLPIVPMQAILGKYVAALALLGLFLVMSLPIVVMLSFLGSPDYGLLVSGYAGVLLLGSLFLAGGMFLSALSGDQIVAFVLSTVLCFVLVLSGHEKVVAVLDGLAPSAAIGTWLHDSISVTPHFEGFVAGFVNLASVLYFLGFGAAFLWLNAVVLARSRA